MPVLQMDVPLVLTRSLMAKGRSSEAAAVAEQALGVISSLGCVGVFEVSVRLAASEAFHGAQDRDRAHIELRETLRQIALRADDITDALWKNSYLTRNPHVVRARELAKEWALDAIVV